MVKKQNKKQPNQLLMILTVVILIFAVGQTFQINALKEDINEGKVTPTMSFGVSAPQVQQVRQAPQMVGGC